MSILNVKAHQVPFIKIQQKGFEKLPNIKNYRSKRRAPNLHLPTAMCALRAIASPILKVPFVPNTAGYWLKNCPERATVKLQDRFLEVEQTIPQLRQEVEKAMNARIKKGAKIINHGKMHVDEAIEKHGNQVFSFCGQNHLTKSQGDWNLVEIQGLITCFVPGDWEFLSDIKDLKQIQIWQCRVRDVKKSVLIDVQVYPDGDTKIPWALEPRKEPKFKKYPKFAYKPKPESFKGAKPCEHDDMLDNFGAAYY